MKGTYQKWRARSQVDQTAPERDRVERELRFQIDEARAA